MSDLTFDLATTPAAQAAVFEIRRVVFVAEQGVPSALETDERDADAEHFLVRLQGRPVGAGRLVVEDPGYLGLPAELGAVAHLGRLAVLPAERGTGLGSVLVSGIEQRARQRGLRAVYLGSQVHAVPFYERLGYATFGAVFDDAGIPHRHMSKQLPAEPGRIEA